MTKEELDLLSNGSVVEDEAHEYYFKTVETPMFGIGEPAYIWYCQHGESWTTTEMLNECEGQLTLCFEAKYG